MLSIIEFREKNYKTDSPQLQAQFCREISHSCISFDLQASWMLRIQSKHTKTGRNNIKQIIRFLHLIQFLRTEATGLPGNKTIVRIQSTIFQYTPSLSN